MVFLFQKIQSLPYQCSHHYPGQQSKPATSLTYKGSHQQAWLHTHRIWLQSKFIDKTWSHYIWAYLRLNSAYLRNLKISTEIHVILYIFVLWSSIVTTNKVCAYIYDKSNFLNMRNLKSDILLDKLYFLELNWLRIWWHFKLISEYTSIHYVILHLR